MKNRAFLYFASVVIALLLFLAWLPTSKVAVELNGPILSSAAGLTDLTQPTLPLVGDGVMGRVTEGDSHGAAPQDEEQLPAKYLLPPVHGGETYEQILAGYWGAEWPAIKEAIIAGGSGQNLATINDRDWSIGTPVVGTAANFFEGLEERSLASFDRFYNPIIFRLPNLHSANYLTQEFRASQVASSKHYNPSGKNLESSSEAALSAYIEEVSAVPILAGESVRERWRQLIREDIRAIVKFEQPSHGRSFIGPMITMPYKTAPLVAHTAPYPVFDIPLCGTNVNEDSTLGGLFSGWLTIWAGSDSLLAHLYDEQSAANAQFQSAVEAFIATL